MFSQKILKFRASESPERCLFLLALRKFCQIVVTILLVFLHKNVHLTMKIVFALNTKIGIMFGNSSKKYLWQNYWKGFSPPSPIAPWSPDNNI